MKNHHLNDKRGALPNHEHLGTCISVHVHVLLLFGIV